MSPASLRDLADRVRALPPRAGGTVVVGVDGRSGSGKTTFARRLVAALRDAGADARTLHLDDVYPGWDGLAAGARALCADVLEALATGRPAGYRRWSWVRSEPAGRAEVRPGGVLVVEGVGAGARCARPRLSLLVWLDAPAPLRRQRALARDGEAYAPHWDRWAAQEEAHHAAEGTRAAAGLLLDGAAPPPGPDDPLPLLPR
ncbi:dephospho-CoA kinase [Vallicoccus soli]|uniref:Dephospho-CoA kinase n=1 Tax=Vallicoccus soli TaxID=2339232 RepID=A0A3A3Z0D4_9ACTN|nr:dephospho-CoA kinase [Vallicoccus soli]RJK96715.1 dephospho-CoA kinase [Vallicoccus soli]